MNDYDITWQTIAYSLYLMLVLCFVLILYIIWTYTKYLMFAVLDKAKIIIHETKIFVRFLGKFPENFQKCSGKYFSGKLTSLHSDTLDVMVDCVLGVTLDPRSCGMTVDSQCPGQWESIVQPVSPIFDVGDRRREMVFLSDSRCGGRVFSDVHCSLFVQSIPTIFHRGGSKPEVVFRDV